MTIDGGARSRSMEDEAVIHAIWEANLNKEKGELIIADARPKVNAVANRAQGKGYESHENYPNMELLFLNIHNIHVMRESQNRLLNLCCNETSVDNDWGRHVEDTGWLTHIRNLLQQAKRFAENVEYGRSVVVHCSDGWDRTAQLCGLMQAASSRKAVAF